jgi:alkylation response protein AidB-like acyl-CoA dehydrogenase
MEFTLSPQQQEAVDLARRLARKVAPNPLVSWEDAKDFSWEFLTALADHGLTGIDLPESLGGQDLTLLDAVLVIEAVAATAPHLADAVHATNFGAIRQMAAFATSQRLEESVRKILAGRALPSIAMSEPGAGSAVNDLRTRARLEAGGYRVNGEKTFNTFGPIATHYVVWARFGDGPRELGAVVVPAEAPGLNRGATKRFISGEQYCSLHFDDVVVEPDLLLLDNDGLRQMMSVFNIERIGNAARSVGLGQLALDLATTYLLNRETGGKRLSDMQGLRWKLADMRMRIDAARLLLYRAASTLKDGLPDPALVAMAKCFANEAGFFAADSALQLYGGYGYTTESPLEYIWKRTRGWMIAGGSVEVMRNRVAVEQLRGGNGRAARTVWGIPS